MFRTTSVQEKGFTLIELMVVVAIVGLLASSILASLDNARGRARDASRIAEFREVMKSLELYRTNVGSYPCSGPVGGNNLDCAATTVNGSATSRIKKGSNTGIFNTVEDTLRQGLKISPSDDIQGTSILYRVRNTGVSNRPDRTSYTLLLGSEADTSYTDVGTTLRFCKVTSGQADTFSNYNGVLFSAIVDCKISKI